MYTHTHTHVLFHKHIHATLIYDTVQVIMTPAHL